MGEHPLGQSALGRAKAETGAAFHSGWFWLGNVVIAGGIGIIAIASTPPNLSAAQAGMFRVASVALGMIAFVCILFVVQLFTAPYRQRNEARRLVEQQRMPSESEVEVTIQLLQAEVLTFTQGNGDVSITYAEVFVAIAGSLSRGIQDDSLKGQVYASLRERLGLGSGVGLFVSDSETDRLFGILFQHDLVDRRIEEYQHMVDNYPPYDPLAQTHNVYVRPSRHLSKGTETKYYLSSLGSIVVRQLRQQSTPDMEGSQP